MPRVAEAALIPQTLPWREWEKQLLKSPTKALLFGQDDFGSMRLRTFQEQAKKEFAHLNVTVGIRGSEVLVAIDAS